MLISFNDSALKHKLISIMLLTSSIVLLITSLSFFTHELLTYRKVMRQELLGIADIISNNTASALIFNDQNAAQLTLQGLTGNPRILKAQILSPEGKVFAEYGSSGLKTNLLSMSPAGKKAFWDWHSPEEVIQKITVDGREVGTVVIQSNSAGLREKLDLFLVVAAISMLVSGLIAYVVSTRLQGLISEPIMRLVQTMKRVSQEKNYQLRTKKNSNDEIGTLIDGFNEMLEEIAERDELLRQRHDHLQQLAHFDSLTRLPNRVLFYDRISQALLQAARLKQKVAILFVDLDHFKDINDTLGHRIGDLLLIEVASRLQEIVRACDTVARMGGDEFTLCLQNMEHPDNAGLVAQKIVNSLARPYTIEGEDIFVSASVGITLFPVDGVSVDELLKNADTAMYHVKDHGKNMFQFFSQEMNDKTCSRLALHNSLRYALERNEFLLYYQPKFDIASRQPTGMEALLRWNNPEKGIIVPDKFIPLAEETGLIVPIGEWVLRTVCEQINSWQAQGNPPLRVSINISPVQFRRDDFAESILRILEETGVNPNLLELELTESALMQNTASTVAILHKCRNLGMHISIDDFGTGYSSLSYLKRFPIDTLKIDRSFIFNLTENRDDNAIVTAIIAMAHSLNLKIIAEGVETEGQLAFLVEQGCEEMQGYLYSRPLPAKEIDKLFATLMPPKIADRQ
ncbi:MAG: GGDEF domain-containing protein [Deltaproteobacteria bacterium HGW-Deltaproteobacteria-4]|nr:MAG: GGDEF domain-containing protein [Deltaproteobacteria bacterium HGW-Deltaproteobacteria-4]